MKNPKRILLTFSGAGVTFFGTILVECFVCEVVSGYRAERSWSLTPKSDNRRHTLKRPLQHTIDMIFSARTPVYS
ncbi:hypothetical protein AB1N83_006950 [Pleurotus pulmonarius]